MKKKPETTDDYLAGLDDERRAALQRLRMMIRDAAPEAEECISYQIPAFRLGGLLVGFGATANHCAFYLMSSTVLASHWRDVAKYETGKGTIRFKPDRPLPAALVRKLVKARIEENRNKGGKKSP